MERLNYFLNFFTFFVFEFQPVRDRRTDGQKDRRTDEQTDGEMDGE